MRFIIDHMEEGLSDWVLVEYEHMIAQLGPENLILAGMTQNTIANIPSSLSQAMCTQKTALEIAPLDKILLLDPAATTPLTPDDKSFEYLLFGGILGDDPPQDRTGQLRKLGFATRHLGKLQMTTDTAVLTAKRIVDGTHMDDLKFVDRPTINLYKNESVEMPFRYLLNDDGQPIMPPGFLDVLRKSNDDVLML